MTTVTIDRYSTLAEMDRAFELAENEFKLKYCKDAQDMDSVKVGFIEITNVFDRDRVFIAFRDTHW